MKRIKQIQQIQKILESQKQQIIQINPQNLQMVIYVEFVINLVIGFKDVLILKIKIPILKIIIIIINLLELQPKVN